MFVEYFASISVERYVQGKCFPQSTIVYFPQSTIVYDDHLPYYIFYFPWDTLANSTVFQTRFHAVEND